MMQKVQVSIERIRKFELSQYDLGTFLFFIARRFMSSYFHSISLSHFYFMYFISSFFRLVLTYHFIFMFFSFIVCVKQLHGL